jgi:asparagine synthase (glutamine-hydrolysing)
MCGIAGIHALNTKSYPDLDRHLKTMNHLQKHRGPDDDGFYMNKNGYIGFAHCRLSIIDLKTGKQPMDNGMGHIICFNGEIYNYLELRQELSDYRFRTTSDTEVILAAYNKWGKDCVQHLRGMFAFAIWDEHKQTLFCARDRFGIKPFYYTLIDGVFYFASEAKTLLPFIPEIRTNVNALKDYLAFQLCLDGKTLFEGILELLPGHQLTIQYTTGRISTTHRSTLPSV